MNEQLRLHDKLFIGGEWVASLDGEMVDSIDPSTGVPWAKVQFGGTADVDRAVAAANEALRGPWSRMSVYERAGILRRFASLYEQHTSELATLESRDNGRPIRETRPDIGAHSQWYHYYAGLADKIDGRMIPVDPSMHVYTTRVPVGVVGAIVPWNAPLLLSAWKIGPALAAGCTVVLKPAETTSVTALVMAKIAEAAGLPKGVLNVVPGHGKTNGAHLVAHPDVHKISFTGDHRTAQAIMKSAAGTLKRLSFENGGKSPHIIFDDADIPSAMNAATHAAFMACGQSCALGSRLLVHEPIYRQVVEELGRRAGRVKVGMPLEEGTQMGPQASAQQLEKTLRYVAIGRDEGAKLVAGGKRLGGDEFRGGYFVEPTVFSDVNNDMRIAQEEIFGPVCSVIPFKTEEDAVAIANGTQYGLTAGIWSQNVGRAHRVANQIQAGTVWVNTYRYLRWNIPYGGFKVSGLGRENGPEALDAYLETRSTIMSLGGSYADAYAS
ncbi:aldehyde dehydrogenase (NAD+) [Rhodoligotrophos appendicifer]|uniref:aldehyde dehydrogenase n=1 Tax=Rhodoligotrophos appendicifer TaxID=987056 RepID=UPI001186B8DB|nr:aldehyde dehydrogenase [Rhodoligotrophos appendicifer]